MDVMTPDGRDPDVFQRVQILLVSPFFPLIAGIKGGAKDNPYKLFGLLWDKTFT
jgi:hypothetical protein